MALIGTDLYRSAVVGFCAVLPFRHVFLTSNYHDRLVDRCWNSEHRIRSLIQLRHFQFELWWWKMMILCFGRWDRNLLRKSFKRVTISSLLFKLVLLQHLNRILDTWDEGVPASTFEKVSEYYRDDKDQSRYVFHYNKIRNCEKCTSSNKVDTYHKWLMTSL